MATPPTPDPTTSETPLRPEPAKPEAAGALRAAEVAAEAVKQVVAPTPGEVITSSMTNNTYTMGEQIGEGSFGIVFSAVDVWQNQLAVKVMKPRGSYEKVKKSTEDEFKKLILLRHPNITYLYDAWEFRDTFYLVTERCDFTLSDIISQEWFHGTAWLRGIARCLLQAVHFIHLNHLCHQDIHPGNVFASLARDEMATGPESGQPGAVQFKLGDLGVAKLFEEVDATNTRNPGILPPEFLDPAEFGPLDHRIDIYHCGLLLLQVALSKEYQFTEEEVKSGKPRELAEQLPQPLNFALGKALRRHVADRTAGAMELWRDLSYPELPKEPTPVQLELPPPPDSATDKPQ